MLILSQFPIAVNKLNRNLSNLYKDITGFSCRKNRTYFCKYLSANLNFTEIFLKKDRYFTRNTLK